MVRQLVYCSFCLYYKGDDSPFSAWLSVVSVFGVYVVELHN